MDKGIFITIGIVLIAGVHPCEPLLPTEVITQLIASRKPVTPWFLCHLWRLISKESCCAHKSKEQH